MRKLLPQANSIDKIIDSFIFLANYQNYTSSAHAEFCHFHPRQSAYYTNACFYLELIDEKRNISEKGRKILESKKVKQGIIETIFVDDLFNKVFSKFVFESKKEASRFGAQLLKDTYPEYSDDVIKRRLSTLLAWCEQIKQYIR